MLLLHCKKQPGIVQEVLSLYSWAVLKACFAAIQRISSAPAVLAWDLLPALMPVFLPFICMIQCAKLTASLPKKLNFCLIFSLSPFWC